MIALLQCVFRVMINIFIYSVYRTIKPFLRLNLLKCMWIIGFLYLYITLAKVIQDERISFAYLIFVPQRAWWIRTLFFAHCYNFIASFSLAHHVIYNVIFKYRLTIAIKCPYTRGVNSYNLHNALISILTFWHLL